MKFFRNKKIIFIVLLVFVILFIGEVKFAHAMLFEITSIVIAGIAQVIGYILGFIGGVFMTVAGYLVNLALNVNFGLLASPIINTGWQIVLNFTNLGFVLAIIIIAFATIFRVQSYAMKQTLGKLIAAALLVNFSLVIAGAFINVSDIFSNFFLKQGGIENPVEWSKSFAGMFQAQALLRIGEATAVQGSQNYAAAAVNEISGTLLTAIASVFFIALFTTLATITLLACAIMLLIRYVYLGILMLLSPIVWLLWIFPSTNHLWQSWWKKFIQWVFFAPIMLFFMSLAMYAMKNQPATVQQFLQNPTSDVKVDFGISVIGEMVIAIGLVMGGLIAANSMGITFSSTAMGWAQGMGKQFGGWVGRKGVRLGTRPLRTKWGQKTIEGLQRAGASKGGIRGFLGRNLISPLGTAIGGVAGVEQGARLVETAGKELNNEFKSDKDLANAFAGLTHEKQIAAVKRFTKNKTMNLMNEKDINYMIGRKNMAGKNATESIFNRYGSKNVYDDFEKAAVRNSKMVQAKTPEEKEEATKEFHKTFKPKDYENVRTKAFTEDKEYAKSNIIGMMSSNPGALAKLFPKLNAKDLDASNPESFYSKVKQHFDENIDKFIHTIDATIDIGGDIGVEAEKKLAWLKARGITEAGFREENNKLNNVYNLITRNLTKRFEQFAPPEEHTPPTETA